MLILLRRFVKSTISLVASTMFGSLLAGCALLDSPTEFTQRTPVHVASNGRSIIFQSPGESNNCILGTGTVSFVSAPRPGGPSGSVRFSYRHGDSTPRNDVVTLATEAGSFSIDGRGKFRLQKLRTNGRQITSKGGANLDVTSGLPGHYRLRARDERGRVTFSGTMISSAGLIYVRDAVLAASIPAYAGKAEHNCGNWDSAGEAAKALRRVEASIPP